MVRMLISLILLGAAFLGGYHMGRQPSSPDLVGNVQKIGQQAVAIGNQAAQAIAQRSNNAPQQAAVEELRR